MLLFFSVFCTIFAKSFCVILLEKKRRKKQYNERRERSGENVTYCIKHAGNFSFIFTADRWKLTTEKAQAKKFWIDELNSVESSRKQIKIYLYIQAVCAFCS